MQKDFDSWNSLKKEVDRSETSLVNFPREGEVWVCMLGNNIGVEQDGGPKTFSRPVLIVKKFNNQMFWIIPISSKQKSLDYYFNFINENNEKASAILAQMRITSVKRLKRKLYEIPLSTFEEIKIFLVQFLI